MRRDVNGVLKRFIGLSFVMMSWVAETSLTPSLEQRVRDNPPSVERKAPPIGSAIRSIQSVVTGVRCLPGYVAYLMASMDGG